MTNQVNNQSAHPAKHVSFLPQQQSGGFNQSPISIHSSASCPQTPVIYNDALFADFRVQFCEFSDNPSLPKPDSSRTVNSSYRCAMTDSLLGTAVLTQFFKNYLDKVVIQSDEQSQETQKTAIKTLFQKELKRTPEALFFVVNQIHKMFTTAVFDTALLVRTCQRLHPVVAQVCFDLVLLSVEQNTALDVAVKEQLRQRIESEFNNEKVIHQRVIDDFQSAIRLAPLSKDNQEMGVIELNNLIGEHRWLLSSPAISEAKILFNRLSDYNHWRQSWRLE